MSLHVSTTCLYNISAGTSLDTVRRVELVYIYITTVSQAHEWFLEFLIRRVVGKYAFTKFGIPKFLAVAVQADRLKPARDDFKSVYFIIERRGGREILQVGTVE